MARKNIKKILKIIFDLFILILAINFTNKFCQISNTANVFTKIEAIICCIIIVFLYDIVIHSIYILIAKKIVNIALNSVNRMNFDIVKNCIKLNNIIEVIDYYIRPQWYDVLTRKHNKIYQAVREAGLEYSLTKLIGFLFSSISFICIYYIFLENINSISHSFSLSFVSKEYLLKVLDYIKENIDLIKDFALFMILIIVTIYKFCNKDRSLIQTIVNEKENENRIEFIKILDNLVSLFDNSLLEIADNMKFIFLRQDSIADKLLMIELDNYYEIQDKHYIKPKLLFKEVSSKYEIEITIKKLFWGKNKKYFAELSLIHPNFSRLYTKLYFDYCWVMQDNKNQRTPLQLLLNPDEYIKSLINDSAKNGKIHCCVGYKEILLEKKSLLEYPIFEATELMLCIGGLVNEYKRYTKEGPIEAIIESMKKVCK